MKLVQKGLCFSYQTFDVPFALSSLAFQPGSSLFTIFDEEEVFTKQATFTPADFRLLA